MHSEYLNGVGYAKKLNKPYWKIGPYFSHWNTESYPDLKTVEVRKIILRYDAIRYYVGNLASTSLGLEYVKPR